jgi:hypothetical protein
MIMSGRARVSATDTQHTPGLDDDALPGISCGCESGEILHMYSRLVS